MLSKMISFTSTFSVIVRKNIGLSVAVSEYRLSLICLLGSFIAIVNQIAEFIVEFPFKRKILSW